MSADSVKRNDGLQKGESNMKENEIKCVLCGLSVEINGFTVNTTDLNNSTTFFRIKIYRH
jgi:hypothetical protein